LQTEPTGLAKTWKSREALAIEPNIYHVPAEWKGGYLLSLDAGFLSSKWSVHPIQIPSGMNYNILKESLILAENPIDQRRCHG